MPQQRPVVVVSGLPRSGTSLLMQMLEAGGLPPLTDGRRAPDASNPRGYLEWEPIQTIRAHPERLDAARGRAVKVVSALLRDLPRDRSYRVLFATRRIEEVAASQRAMLRARGRDVDDGVTTLDLAGHLDAVRAWLGSQPGFETCYVDYAEILRDPLAAAGRIRRFLDLELDADAMAAVVDAALHRERHG